MIYVCTNIELKDIQHKQTNMSVEYHIYTKIYAQMQQRSPPIEYHIYTKNICTNAVVAITTKVQEISPKLAILLEHATDGEVRTQPTASSIFSVAWCLCFHGRFGGRSYLCGERASCTLWTGRIVDHTISGAMAPACAFLRPHVLLDPFCVKCLRSRHPRPLGHVGQMGKWRFS